MKLIYILLIISIFCGIATPLAEDFNLYTIRVIVWDINGNFESDILLTSTYNNRTDMVYTAEDGTAAFSTLNLGDVPDGEYIEISCKYGTKQVPINYKYGITGVTFNEPDEATSIAMWLAMGFGGVISLGSGIYYLIKKSKKEG